MNVNVCYNIHSGLQKKALYIYIYIYIEREREREREREYQNQPIVLRVTLDSPCPGDIFKQVKIRQLKECENLKLFSTKDTANQNHLKGHKGSNRKQFRCMYTMGFIKHEHS
jgi:hypothetical protein